MQERTEMRHVHLWQEAEKDEIAVINKYCKAGYELVSHAFYRNDKNQLMISLIFRRKCDNNCDICHSADNT